MAVINSRRSKGCRPETNKTWWHSVTDFPLKLLLYYKDEMNEIFGLVVAPHIPVVVVVVVFVSHVFERLGNIQKEDEISFLFYVFCRAETIDKYSLPHKVV